MRNYSLTDLIIEIQSRDKDGKGIEDLRGQILDQLQAFERMPTGGAAVAQFINTFGGSTDSVVSHMRYTPIDEARAANFIAGLQSVMNAKK